MEGLKDRTLQDKRDNISENNNKGRNIMQFVAAKYRRMLCVMPQLGHVFILISIQRL